MMTNKISGPNNYQVHKVRLTADLLDIDLKADLTTDAVVMKIGGLQINGANAAMRTLARMKPAADLFGRGFEGYAKVEEYIDWVCLELEPYLDLWLQAKANGVRGDVSESITEELRNKLAHIERCIDSQYLVGDNLTLADICLISALFEPLSLSQQMIAEDSNLAAYMAEKTNMDSVQRIFGAFGSGPTLAVEESEQTLHGKVDEIRVELEKDDISHVWSRLKAFSLWRVSYRFPEYNIIVSVSRGKVNKYKEQLKACGGICGSLSVNGERSGFQITGALIFEGSDLPEYLSDIKDAQFYSLERISLGNSEQKAKFEELLKSDIVEGERVQERFYF